MDEVIPGSHPLSNQFSVNFFGDLSTSVTEPKQRSFLSQPKPNLHLVSCDDDFYFVYLKFILKRPGFHIIAKNWFIQAIEEMGAKINVLT